MTRRRKDGNRTGPSKEELERLRERFRPAKPGEHKSTSVEEKRKRNGPPPRPRWRRPTEEE